MRTQCAPPSVKWTGNVRPLSPLAESAVLAVFEATTNGKPQPGYQVRTVAPHQTKLTALQLRVACRRLAGLTVTQTAAELRLARKIVVEYMGAVVQRFEELCEMAKPLGSEQAIRAMIRGVVKHGPSWAISEGRCAI